MLWAIFGETVVFAAGWTLGGGEKLYADYVVTLILAWTFGIAFQYFNIKPMTQLLPLKALTKSIQTDTLSIPIFPNRDVWMDGHRILPAIPAPSSAAEFSQVLVHDADRDASWVHDFVSSERLAFSMRN